MFGQVYDQADQCKAQPCFIVNKRKSKKEMFIKFIYPVHYREFTIMWLVELHTCTIFGNDSAIGASTETIGPVQDSSSVTLNQHCIPSILAWYSQEQLENVLEM